MILIDIFGNEKVQTQNLTCSNGKPSYAWNRPCITKTSTFSKTPNSNLDSCPVTVETGKCGISSYGKQSAFSKRSANPAK